MGCQMKYMKLGQQARKDFLGDLEAMPDYLASAFRAFDAADLKKSGASGSFSPIEHVWHLFDLERDGFAKRISRLRNEVRPVLPDFDGELVAREGNYKNRSFEKGIAEFRAARAANISALRDLSAEDWLRSGLQEGVGPVSMCDIPAMMAEHDETHRLEIDEWLRGSHA